MTADAVRVLAVGAHPDDCDRKAGGVACTYAAAGHEVRFVSMTNGAAGHHEQAGATLVRRRRAGANAAAEAAGVDVRTLDNPDGRLRPSLDVRDRLVRPVRGYDPALVFTHRRTTVTPTTGTPPNSSATPRTR